MLLTLAGNLKARTASPRPSPAGIVWGGNSHTYGGHSSKLR
jgi:hypothetical protein